MPYFREEDKKTRDRSWSDEAQAMLVLAIQTIDDHFYARKQPKEILELRHRLDLILNSDHWADKRIKEEHQRLYNYYGDKNAEETSE